MSDFIMVYWFSLLQYVLAKIIEAYLEILLKTRKGPDTVRRLSAGQRAKRPSPIVSNEVKTQSIIFEPECYSLWSSWPAERLLTVSGPFLDNNRNHKLTIFYQREVQEYRVVWTFWYVFVLVLKLKGMISLLTNTTTSWKMPVIVENGYYFSANICKSHCKNVKNRVWKFIQNKVGWYFAML